jgi:hypothetical protein
MKPNTNDTDPQSNADTNPAMNPTAESNTAPAPPADAKAISPALDQPKPTAAYQQNPADAVAPIDKTCFVSLDEQFRIEQLVKTAAKYPPSPYPCIVMQFFPEDHTRIRELEGGGVEAMLTNHEIEQFIIAFNNAALASGKGRMFDVLQHVPEKTKQHKAKWCEYNEIRLGLRPKPRRSWWAQRKNNENRDKN